jgi:hypothetical protein
MIAAAVVAAVLVLTGGAKLAGAAEQRRAATDRLLQARADAERVLALRAVAQTVALGAQPQQDVFRRANGVLDGAGLVRTRVQSVNAAGDRALESAGTPARRVQSVRLVLEPMALGELGAFLDHWSRDQALWTIVGVDLQALVGRGASPGDYRATLTASAVYAAEATSTSAGSTTP